MMDLNQLYGQRFFVPHVRNSCVGEKDALEFITIIFSNLEVCDTYFQQCSKNFYKYGNLCIEMLMQFLNFLLLFIFK